MLPCKHRSKIFPLQCKSSFQSLKFVDLADLIDTRISGPTRWTALEITDIIIWIPDFLPLHCKQLTLHHNCFSVDIEIKIFNRKRKYSYRFGNLKTRNCGSCSKKWFLNCIGHRIHSWSLLSSASSTSAITRMGEIPKILFEAVNHNLARESGAWTLENY